MLTSALVFLLFGAAPPAPTPLRLERSDAFSANTLRDYKVKGDVKWQKGTVALGKRGELIRNVPPAAHIDVRVTVRLRAGEGFRVANVKINGPERSPGLLLISIDGNTMLSLPLLKRRIPLRKAAPGARPAEEVWRIRIAVRYGLARFKVWPEGERPPAEWRAVYYLGHPSWEARAVSVFGGGGGGCDLTRLDIRAAPPEKALSAAQKRKARAAIALHKGAIKSFEKGDYAEAVRQARASIALLKEAFGPEHLATLFSLQNTGAFLQALGEYKSARGFLQECLAGKQRRLGADHPSTALTHNALAAVLQNLGERGAARRHVDLGLAIRRKVLGERHPDTATSYNNLAAILREQGDLRQARPMLEKALAINRKVLGENHPSTARAWSNLARCLSELGDYDGALKYDEKALAIVRRTRGSTHPETAVYLANLGSIQARRGQYPAARKHLLQALAIARARLGEEHLVTADCMVRLGHVLHEQGEFSEARKILESSLAIHRKKLGPSHPGLGQVLEALGDLSLASKDYASARARYEQVLVIRRKTAGNRSVLMADVLARLSRAWLQAGDPVQARSHAEKDLAIRVERQGEQHPATAAAHARMTQVLIKLGEYRAARTHCDRALTVLRRKLGAHHPNALASIGDLAGLCQDLGDYPTARKHYLSVLAARKKTLGADHPSTATVLYNLGTLARDMGDYPGARSLLEQALAVRRKTLGARHPQTAMVLGQLGILLHDVGDLRAARRYYQEALDAHRDKLGPHHPVTLTSLHNLAGLLADLNELDSARKHYEHILAIDKTRASGSLARASALSSLAAVLARLERMKEAQAYLDEAFAIERKKLGDDHRKTALGRLNLALLASARGQHKVARIQGEKALASMRKALGADHPVTGKAAQWLGIILARAGEDRLAWRHLRDGTVTHASTSRGLLATSAEREHAVITASWRPGLEALLSLATRAPSLDEGQARELLAAVLDWKAISGRALAARQTALLAGADAEALRLDGQLKILRQRLVRALLHGGDAQPAAKHKKALAKLRQEHDDLERQLARRVAGYAALQKASRAGPAEVGARLGLGDVLIELVKYRQFRFKPALNEFAPQYAALLLWRKGETSVVRLVSLGDAATVDKAIHAWRASAQRGAVQAERDRQLTERVWRPLARALPAGARRLLIVPDGELALLPFEALRSKAGTYLVERYQIAYLSAGRDLMPQPLVKGKVGPALVLADPDYDSPGAAGTAARPAAPGGTALRSRDWPAKRPFKRLPGFAREADAVARLLKGKPGWTVRAHRAGQASEETLQGAVRPRLLYLITHGFFLADLPTTALRTPQLRELELVDTVPVAPRPKGLPAFGDDPRLRSGVALAGANRWKERAQKGLSDGLLTALEVQNLDLWRTELVVLSACETGLGEVQVGEGVLGLRRAFQQAGARTVLASLWKVPDAETEQLMSAFFRHWLDGKKTGKAQALRKAQLELIKKLRADKDPKRRAAPPLFWAGFICHGQPD
jgi:tetratricopeptide (TPR) repeat protein